MTTSTLTPKKWTRDKAKGPEGSGRCVEVQHLGWTTRGKEEQIESITSSLNLLMDAKEKIKLELKLKCLHQTILASSVWSPNQQHKHLRRAGETQNPRSFPDRARICIQEGLWVIHTHLKI